jgi:predicted nucleic acid-binding protein
VRRGPELEGVLVDTSAWIDFFRGREPRRSEVDGLIARESALRCGPVELELRHGLRRSEAGRVIGLWRGLRAIPTDELDYASAGDLLRELREQGIALPSMDALIATLALRHDVPLLTNDRHFEAVPGLRLWGAEVGSDGRSRG